MGKFTAGIAAPVETGPSRAEAAAAADLTEQVRQQMQGTAQVETPVAPQEPQFVEETTPRQFQGSPEQVAQLQQMGGTRIEEGPEGQVAREATPEEIQEDYEEELSREDQGFDLYDPATGEVTIPTGGLTKGTSGVGKLQNDLARFGMALSSRAKRTEGPRNARVKVDATGTTPGLPEALVEPLQRLGVAKEIKKNQFAIDENASQLAYLALLATLRDLNQVEATATEAKALAAPQGVTQEEALADLKPSDLKRFEDKSAIPRWQLNEQLGERFVQMLAPSANIDPQTGQRIGEETGYVAPAGRELTAEQKQQLGHYITTAAEWSGVGTGINLPNSADALFTRRLKPGNSPGTTPYEYLITPIGANYLKDMAPMLDVVFPGKSRPVSLVKNPGGKGLSKAAIRHKARTKVPDETGSDIPSLMQEALDVLGQTPNFVNNEKLDFMKVALKDTVEKQRALYQQAAANVEAQGVTEYKQAAIEQEANRLVAENPALESQFAVMFNQDRKSLIKKANAAGIAKYGHGTNFPDYRFATQVRDASLVQAMKTLGDPLDSQKVGDADRYRNKVFYYQGTVVGNSGRIMVSNTELNYQNNKLSRYLVDNPTPVQVTKGGKNDWNFMYVAARTIVDGADTLTPDRLVEDFRKMLPALTPVAQRMAAAVKSQDVNALNAAFAEVKNVPGIPQDWGMSDEWGFVMDGLVELGKYSQLEPGQSFSTRLKAEGDGINNGSSIQGLQFGNRTIVERAGVIYDADTGEVIPKGNMRKALFESMMRSPDRIDLKEDLDAREALVSFFNLINSQEPETRSKLIKKLVKIPLMTTVYGMPPNGHVDHINNWFAENSEYFAGLDPDDLKQVQNLVNKSMENSLVDTLGDAIVHQKLVKETAGYLFNAMEEIAHIRGANGYYWQAGGYEMEREIGNIQLETYPVGEGGQRLPEAEGVKLSKKGAATSKFESSTKVASALAAKRGEKKKRPFDDEGNEIPMEDLDAYKESGREVKWEEVPGKKQLGKALRNQLPVNGTHNIDATIAQRTMVRAANEGVWGHQVFDAFMGDVETFGRIMDIANEEFVEVNREYDLIAAEKEALEAAFNRYKKKIDDSGVEEFDLAQQRGLKFFLEQHATGASNWTFKDGAQLREALGTMFGIEFDKIETPWASGEGVSVRYVPNLEKSKKLNKAQMRSLMTFILNHFGMKDPSVDPKEAKVDPMMRAFDKAIAKAKAGRDDVMRQLNRQKGKVRQYN